MALLPKIINPGAHNFLKAKDMRGLEAICQKIAKTRTQIASKVN